MSMTPSKSESRKRLVSSKFRGQWEAYAANHHTQCNNLHSFFLLVPGWLDGISGWPIVSSLYLQAVNAISFPGLGGIRQSDSHKHHQNCNIHCSWNHRLIIARIQPQRNSICKYKRTNNTSSHKTFGLAGIDGYDKNGNDQEPAAHESNYEPR